MLSAPSVVEPKNRTEQGNHRDGGRDNYAQIQLAQRMLTRVRDLLLICVANSITAHVASQRGLVDVNFGDLVIQWRMRRVSAKVICFGLNCFKAFLEANTSENERGKAYFGAFFSPQQQPENSGQTDVGRTRRRGPGPKATISDCKA